MRPSPKLMLLFAAVLALTACATPAPRTDAAASEKEITQRVSLLLDRYSRNDQAGVVAMLDPERFTMLGTQFSEKIDSPSALRSMMDKDFGQWQTVKVSDVHDLDVRTDGNLATAYLVMNWTAGTGPTVPIRLTTTWRRVKGEWLLTQSASALPPSF